MKNSLLGIIALLITSCVNSDSTTVKHESKNTFTPKYDSLAARLVKTGYMDFFLRMDYHNADTVWQGGRNKSALMEIVCRNHYDDYVRLLSSELLFHYKQGYPPMGFEDTLAYIYSRALYITDDTVNRYRILANQWGFMYYTDKDGIIDYGELGTHLMLAGKKAVPYLEELLNDNNTLEYEGSKEAIVGNSLYYRVKDAAAFYIGKLMEIPVGFHEENSERDKEIEKLKEKLK
jgi:hypothetical protein